jgi:hypothetical protein
LCRLRGSGVVDAVRVLRHRYHPKLAVMAEMLNVTVERRYNRDTHARLRRYWHIGLVILLCVLAWRRAAGSAAQAMPHPLYVLAWSHATSPHLT